MKYGWLLMALLIGILIPIQTATNSRMRFSLVHPVYSAWINFAVGAIALTPFLLLTVFSDPEGNWRQAANAPWWAWLGGLIGAIFVIVAILAVPNTGTATFLAAAVTGQLIGAVLLDHFGWLGLAVRPISFSRLLGGILLLAGVWLIQRRS